MKFRNLLLSTLITSPAFAQSRHLESAPIPPSLGTGEKTTVKQQAGIGSDVAYASAGVLETGGYVGYSNSKELEEWTVAPTIGYFFADNLELSAIASWNSTKIEHTEENRKVDSWSFVLEPSIHQPITRANFVFLGLGVGALGSKDSTTTDSWAFAPRIGFKSLVGRSGMVNIALQRLVTFTEDKDNTEDDKVEIKNTTNLSVGYTILL